MRLGNGFMHAVQAANKGGLAAAGWTDDGGDCVGAYFMLISLRTCVLAKPGVQVLHFDSNTHRMKAPCKLGVVRQLPRLVTMRTAATATTIKTISINAPAQACRCHSQMARWRRQRSERQGRRGLVGVEIPELISEGGKEQRSGLSGHPRKGQHAAGNHAIGCGTKRDRQGRSPLRNAQPERGLANSVRHHEQHFLGGARNRGNHHDGQGDAAGQRGEVLLRERPPAHRPRYPSQWKARRSARRR